MDICAEGEKVMVIAGPCLFVDDSQSTSIVDTALALADIGVDYFRCKIYGGGPNIEKYVAGVRDGGIPIFSGIDSTIMPVLTEIRTIEQYLKVSPHISGVWIGARNAQNYDLIEYCCTHGKNGELMIKRGFGMTIDEAIGIYDLCEKKFGKRIYLIDRGIVTFDRHPVSRWSPDLKGALVLKNERPDIFSRLVVDCSHSVFDKRMVGDVFRAFKAVGVEHFMFECTIDGKSVTDQAHMLSVAELEKILA
jgi:3-deoxy-7-phosphoheptulonate synthase